ncbi:MAG: ribonuclease III [Bacteroidales bacterium]
MLKALYNRIRLFRLRSKEPYSVYYKILGFVPEDLSIYEQAFLHRSSSIKTEKGKWINNERLEFLGDAVLDTVVADVLFHKFETKKEGFLTNTRSKIVQREMLNKLALELGLDKLVVSSTRSVSHNNYMYGNAFEAFIGAIYVDQGYDVCKQFIEERVIAPYIDLVKISRKEVNFKSKLIEWSQKNKVKIDFDLIESFTDGDNNPVFQTQVVVCGIPGGIGTGYSKKESQQNAAKATLKKIQSDSVFQKDMEVAKEELLQQQQQQPKPEPISEPELPFSDEMPEQTETPAQEEGEGVVS